MERYQLHLGDCLEIMKTMSDGCMDSVVTDPPYHLKSIVKRFGKNGSAPAQFGTDGAYSRHSTGFMGKEWDGGEIAQNPEMWAEVLRVAKPGAFLLAFGGTRTYHRMMVAIEDAGWEIRDCIMWVYGSGFPKSHNLHGEREGWGTALKPAWEPIVVARKMVEGSVAQNVLEFGTGAMNIDGCRVSLEGEDQPTGSAKRVFRSNQYTEEKIYGDNTTTSPLGRWPANLIHDGSEEVLALFPKSEGQNGDVVGQQIEKRSPNGIFGLFGPAPDRLARGDSGSSARFFYCAKADKNDRDDGLDGMPFTERRTHGEMAPDASGVSHNTTGQRPAIGRNHHPTVKPTSLMRYLCRLVTPPNGVVFDPFMGSGSTGKAAMIENFNFVGIDKEAEYFEIAERRIRHVASNGPLFEPVEEMQVRVERAQLSLPIK